MDFQRGGQIGCVLRYQGPGISMKVIPSTVLIPRPSRSKCKYMVIQRKECPAKMHLALYSEVTPCTDFLCGQMSKYTVSGGKGIALRGSGYGCTIGPQNGPIHRYWYSICMADHIIDTKPKKACIHWIVGTHSNTIQK